MRINETIREERRRLSVSQEALAKALNVTVQAVSKWECDTSMPDTALLPEVARYFGITMDELFFGRGAAKTEATPARGEALADIADDGRLRIVQFLGKRLLGKSDWVEGGLITLDMRDIDAPFDVEIWGNATIAGDVGGYVKCEGNVNVSSGSVGGDVSATGYVNCADIAGNVSVGGGLTCANIAGNVSADGHGRIQCVDVAGDVNGGGVTCANVAGDVNAGGVTCADVGGNVSAGGVTCESVGGDVSGGNVKCDGEICGDVKANVVTCGDVGGDVRTAREAVTDYETNLGGAALGSVSCGDVAGDVSAGGDVKCGDVEGDVAGNNVRCGDVSGDVTAAGDVKCGEVGGDISAEGGVTAR